MRAPGRHQARRPTCVVCPGILRPVRRIPLDSAGCEAGPLILTFLPPLSSDDPSAKGFSMTLEFRKNKDFCAGTMLTGMGAAATFIARDYRFDNTLRTGPRYFPSVLGGIRIPFDIITKNPVCA